MDPSYLRVDGAHIVDGSGLPVALVGVNLGGWMNWEGFITGHPGAEGVVRAALRDVLGPERYRHFSDRLLEAFYGESDAAWLASLGFTAMRIPVNYRHLEDDAAPFRLIEGAFRHLDRVIAINARHGIHSIIDLHAAQGWQNAGWHSNNPVFEPLTWEHPHFQDRIAWLWVEIAKHYRDQPWVAGYNLLNEPMDPGGRVDAFHVRLMTAIRAVDPEHLFVLDPDYWHRGVTWDLPGEPADIVYDVHHYPGIGFAGSGAYPGVDAWGETWDRQRLDRDFCDATAWIRERGAPILVGEFGPMADPDAVIAASRTRLTADLLAVYGRRVVGWTYWTYKDIGTTGLVRVKPSSEWRVRLAAPIEKKRRLAVDFWGTRPDDARQVWGAFQDLVDREFPADRARPWGTRRRVWNLLGEKLLSELLVEEFAACFRGLDDAVIDAMVDSFRFEQCTTVPDLAAVLSEAAVDRASGRGR